MNARTTPTKGLRLRRVLGRGLFATLLVGAIAGGVLAWERLDVPVSVVEVSGELTAAERARAIELVAAFLPSGIFELDTEALRERLVDESWIDAASVRRRWPETVEIRISPEVAVARWQGDALLSSRGAVIEPLELVGVDSLPRLSGPSGSAPEVMRVFQVVTDVLRPLGLEVEALERDAVGDVQVRTRSGLVIALGALPRPEGDTIRSRYAAWDEGYFTAAANEIAGSWLGYWIVVAAAASNIGLYEAEMSSDAFQLMGMAENVRCLV